MKLRQWFCRGPRDTEYIFTHAECGPDTALAIAQATFGRTIGSVIDEGTFNQESFNEALAAIK